MMYFELARYFLLSIVIAFFDTVLLILLNKVLPIVIVIAIILWILRSGRGK